MKAPSPQVHDLLAINGRQLANTLSSAPAWLAETQKLLPLINDGGRIVTVSSGLTRIVIPGSAPYAAMKGAIEVLTRYLAKELGPRRIAVNCVAPGAIATTSAAA